MLDDLIDFAILAHLARQQTGLYRVVRIPSQELKPTGPFRKAQVDRLLGIGGVLASLVLTAFMIPLPRFMLVVPLILALASVRLAGQAHRQVNYLRANGLDVQPVTVYQEVSIPYHIAIDPHELEQYILSQHLPPTNPRQNPPQVPQG